MARLGRGTGGDVYWRGRPATLVLSLPPAGRRPTAWEVPGAARRLELRVTRPALARRRSPSAPGRGQAPRASPGVYVFGSNSIFAMRWAPYSVPQSRSPSVPPQPANPEMSARIRASARSLTACHALRASAKRPPSRLGEELLYVNMLCSLDE